LKRSEQIWVKQVSRLNVKRHKAELNRMLQVVQTKPKTPDRCTAAQEENKKGSKAPAFSKKSSTVTQDAEATEERIDRSP
jgi:hypothetical protein